MPGDLRTSACLAERFSEILEWEAQLELTKGSSSRRRGRGRSPVEASTLAIAPGVVVVSLVLGPGLGGVYD